MFHQAFFFPSIHLPNSHHALTQLPGRQSSPQHNAPHTHFVEQPPGHDPHSYRAMQQQQCVQSIPPRPSPRTRQAWIPSRGARRTEKDLILQDAVEASRSMRSTNASTASTGGDACLA
uniref:Uncharacterized protein n=1 Tax=Arundo donax TaxID=35708 RepID=A0A0A8XQU4_ARUDO